MLFRSPSTRLPAESELAASFLDQIQQGDALMVKGSNGSRMRLVVDEIKTRLDKEYR